MAETDQDEAGFAAAGALAACFLCLGLALAADAGAAGVAAATVGVAGVAGVAAGAWAKAPNENAATTTAAMIFFMMRRFLEEVGERSDSIGSVHSTRPFDRG